MGTMQHILWGDRNTKVGLRRGATSRTEDKPGYFLDDGPQSFFILLSSMERSSRSIFTSRSRPTTAVPPTDGSSWRS